MRNYRTSAATIVRLDYGLELVEGLRLFPETASFAADFEGLNDELEKAHNARRATRPALVKARVLLRFANYETDQCIRMCGKVAEVADGGRRGDVFKVLFPQGIGPVIAPLGARQLKPTEDLIDRLRSSKHDAVIAFSLEWRPKLEAALKKLQGAADLHKAARSDHATTFLEELSLRSEHRRSVDRLMGHVRAAFPGDKAKQDLVFPVVEDGGGEENVDDGTDEADGSEAEKDPA